MTAAAVNTVMTTLNHLAVKGRAPKTGYSRAQFGPAWSDTNHNGCDTRNDILKRDLGGDTFRAGTRDCAVLSGRLNDPYTGLVIQFVKANASAVQIDHVVALSDSWQTGSANWPAAKRLAFANDPLNLLAVDGSTNEAKGDADAASWLPPNKSYRCNYVARQVAVKAMYQLWVTPAERDAMRRVLGNCTGVTLPAGGNPTLPPTATRTTSPAPRPSTTVAVAPQPTTPSAPAGATAICNDGTFSYSKHRSGTCSHHGGVAVWF
jgi:hypothetical protein